MKFTKQELVRNINVKRIFQNVGKYDTSDSGMMLKTDFVFIFGKNKI